MSQIRFEPQTWTRAAEGMSDAGEELAQRTQALLGQVSDLSVLGTNDTLGGVCQMIYGTYLQVFTETVTELIQGYGEEASGLHATAAAYQGVEDANASGGEQLSQIVDPGVY